MMNEVLQGKITHLVGIGFSDTEIVEYCGKNQDLKILTVEEVTESVRNAKIYLSTCAKVDGQHEHGVALWRLNDLFKKSMTIQDYKGCLAIQKEIDVLMKFTNGAEHIDAEELL